MRACVIFLLLSAAGAQSALPQLLAEADRNNPRIQATREAWRAAQSAIAPAGALPDPEVLLQPFSVGNPLPFAGYERSNFAYIGLGISQQIPYPGKLRLQKAVAASQADVARAQSRTVRIQVQAAVEAAYDQLAWWQADRDLLRQQQAELDTAVALAQESYRTGHGSQAQVLEAQLARTALARDMAEQQQQESAAQAQLRELLARPPSAPAIVAAPLRQTRLEAGDAEVMAKLPIADPALAISQAQIAGAAQGLKLAQRSARPDFSAQYMYQRTGPGFPDYYMLTLGMTLPWLHRADRYRPAVEQAVAQQAGAQADARASLQQQQFQLTNLLLTAHRDQQFLRIDREGLLPQARAEWTAALTAYRNGQGTLDELLRARQKQLEVEQQYAQTLAEHEATLGQITALTGVPHD